MEAFLATEREVERLLELVGTPPDGRMRQPQRWKAIQELIAARMRQGDETEALRWVRTLKEGAEAGDVDAIYYARRRPRHVSSPQAVCARLVVKGARSGRTGTIQQVQRDTQHSQGAQKVPSRRGTRQARMKLV
jgi:hypothetical protein